MPQIINTNIASISAQRNLDNSQKAGDRALQRLSSGLRINGAKDDAAGLAISNRITAQVRGTAVASRNAGDGVSLAQTAEGALNSMRDSLQRIRELALQSANGSNTDLERSSLQEEVDQLKSEIASISEKTSFNGQKLLNGDFEGKTFQTGANVGETISVSIAKINETTLGTSLSNGISTSSTSAAMAAGDLVINGTAVGASTAASDGASTTMADRSAIAVAAAINAVSADSGVTATADVTTVKGSSTTSVAASATAITINGTAITVAGSGIADNLAADLQGVADTINGFTGQTGVVASVDVNNLDAGVILTAEDGRNIDIGTDGSTFGLAANGTTTGTVSLISTDGTSIEISSNTGNSLENAGIEIGTYSGSNSGVTGQKVTTTALAAGDLTINGVSVGASLASDDTASTTGKNYSAISKAEAINRVSDQTGVTATANATQVTSADYANTTGVTDFVINGVSIAATGDTATAGDQINSLVSNINAKTDQTGVRAEVIDGNNYQLIADDGRNITVAGTNTGFTAGTTSASLSLESAGTIEIGTATSVGPAAAGLTVGSYGGGETGTLLKDIDISTIAGANDAIKGIDNAINQVSQAQAKLGAIQNRFEATISNLAVQGENLQAANSRIQDADFAKETAELSRTQVLQQAGISVLSQANSKPQQALSLLQ